MAKQNFRVMLSSTFLDLEEHRDVAARALRKHGLDVIAMEDKLLSPTRDVIDESLAKVESADAYLCLVGKRYGEVRPCAGRNPHGLSTTALELERAKARGLPIAALLFSPEYALPDSKVDYAPEQRQKLEALRHQLLRHRVAGEVRDLADFREAAQVAAFELLQALQEHAAIAQGEAITSTNEPAAVDDLVPPSPPAFHFAVPFAQGMPFAGRAQELERISEWARSDGQPMLVVEAIGGMGKSMVTHHWATEHAANVLPKLAGRFWYSFYEEGASMRDFCVQALAYIENVAPSRFRKVTRHDLRLRLLQRLAESPWVLVLDGLERVLIAYHSYDAAQLTDEEADQPRPGEEGRDPNLCIRPDDDELLRNLTSVHPSKLLVSTRNMPTALRLAGGGVLRAGVEHLQLTGLAGDDVERLMRRAGVSARDGAPMRDYIERNFGNHPLMIGVVAGLVMEHLPAPGDFDHWIADEGGASALDLAAIDGLVGKRNHVLQVAFEGLEKEARQLLTQLSFFSSAVPYRVLLVLNPDSLSAGQELSESARIKSAESWLRPTLHLLQRRGLVIRDAAAASYDLHPLVRGFTRAGLSDSDRATVGAHVVDYARTQAPKQVSLRSSAEELDAFFEVSRLLMLGGETVQAVSMLSTSIYPVVNRTGRSRLHFDLLRQLFKPDFSAPQSAVPNHSVAILANQVALVAGDLGRLETANSAFRLALRRTLKDRSSLDSLQTALDNVAFSEQKCGRFAAAKRLTDLGGEVANAAGGRSIAHHAYVLCMNNLVRGDFDWRRHAPAASLDDPEAFSGNAYMVPWLVALKLQMDGRAGRLTETSLEKVEANSSVWSNESLRPIVLKEKARLFRKRGVEARARVSFAEAIKIGRENDTPVAALEAEYATTLVRLGDIAGAREEADRLNELREPPHLRLAELWLALGEQQYARAHAVLAYEKAWADGPPNASHWDLEDCRAVLKALGESEPALATVRPEDLPAFDFEEEILERLALSGKGL